MGSTSRHFLILDDEESIRQSIAAYMEDEGYIVFKASSGEDALKIVKNNRIDDAIVDIRLPGLDGNMFMIEARKLQPEIKFIVHTGSADYTPPEAVRKLGITLSDVFIKPAGDIKTLHDALRDQD